MRRCILSTLLALSACWCDVDPSEDAVSAAQCEPDALRCDGRVLTLCLPDGTGEAVLELCASPELCDPTFGCEPPAASLSRRGEPLTIPYAIK